MPTAQIDALCRRVERLGRQHPPIPTLETPGFVLVGRPYDPRDAARWADPPKSRGFNRIELMQVALIGALLTVGAFMAVAYFTSPSIANL